jgi:hypothetical protein
MIVQAIYGNASNCDRMYKAKEHLKTATLTRLQRSKIEAIAEPYIGQER